MINQKSKCEAFRKLHYTGEAFIVPNPWDLGSAKILQGLGFKALATTSVGLAYSHGMADGELSLGQILRFCTELAANTHIPVTVDFENAFAARPEDVAQNVAKLVETGVAGCSVEDFDSKARHIYDFNLAVERIQAAAEVVSKLGMPFQLTARAENLFRGVNDIDDTIKRLKAFETAGANVLYVPSLTSLAQLRLVTAELSLPFNVLAPPIKGASLRDLQQHGATRISLGGALNWHAVNPVMQAAREMLAEGTFNWTSNLASKKDVMQLFDR